jgi:hypothetical protein
MVTVKVLTEVLETTSILVFNIATFAPVELYMKPVTSLKPEYVSEM